MGNTNPSLVSHQFNPSLIWNFLRTLNTIVFLGYNNLQLCLLQNSRKFYSSQVSIYEELRQHGEI